MSWFSDAWDSITDFFEDLWEDIKEIIAKALVIIAALVVIWAVFFSGGAALLVFGFAVTPTMAIVAGVVMITAAFLIDEEAATEMVNDIGEALANVAETVAEVATDIAVGASKGIWNALKDNPLLLIGLGIGGYFLVKKMIGSDDSQQPAPVSSNSWLGDSEGDVINA